MKNYLALFAITAAVLLSCNNEGGLSDTAKKNLEVNDAIMKAYEAGDFTKMADYIATDAVDHAGENGDIKGLDNIISEMKKYKEMVTDMKTTQSRSLADDEYVYTWASGSYKMDGKQMNMSSVDVTKFKDGKAVEHWMYMDPKDMSAMMAPPMPMDSSMHHHADSLIKK